MFVQMNSRLQLLLMNDNLSKLFSLFFATKVFNKLEVLTWDPDTVNMCSTICDYSIRIFVKPYTGESYNGGKRIK